MVSRGRKILSSLAVTAVAGSLIVFAGPPAAYATPTNQTVASAAAKLNDLEEQLGALEEKFSQARDAEKASAERVKTLAADVAAQQAKVTGLRAQVAAIARATFQNSGVDTTTQLFVSGDPDNFLQQISTVAKVDENMNDIMQQFQSEQANLSDLKLAADAEAAKSAEALKAVQDTTDQAKAKIAEQKQLLNSLSAQERAAAEATADPTTADVTPPPDAGGAVGSGGSAAGRKAAAYAIAQVGDAYVWGSDGPNSFDCSGLMLAAYRTAGISLPHSSNTQSRMGTAVSRNDLQPGDLIFYYSPVHHVGMYVGNGMFVHARNTRVGVVMQSVSSYPAPWSGARRVVG